RITARAAASSRARSNALCRAAISSRLSALRLSARLMVTTAAGPRSSYSTRSLMLPHSFGALAEHWSYVEDTLQGHLQQRHCQRLALTVDPQRPRRAAGKGVVEQEVERPQVRGLEPLDATDAQGLEVAADDLGGQVLAEPAEAGLRVGDDGDVGVVALVA